MATNEQQITKAFWPVAAASASGNSDSDAEISIASDPSINAEGQNGRAHLPFETVADPASDSIKVSRDIPEKLPPFHLAIPPAWDLADEKTEHFASLHIELEHQRLDQKVVDDLLFQMVLEGRTDEIKMLVKNHGADINARNAQGNTPLIEAIISCDERAVMTILEAGADPCFKGKSRMHASDVARRHINIAKARGPSGVNAAKFYEYIAKKLDPIIEENLCNERFIMRRFIDAVDNGDKEDIKNIIKNNPDLASHMLNSMDPNGWVPLMRAPDSETFDLLWILGADPQDIDPDLVWTPDSHPLDLTKWKAPPLQPNSIALAAMELEPNHIFHTLKLEPLIKINPNSCPDEEDFLPENVSLNPKDQALIKAVRNNDLQSADQALEDGANANSMTELGPVLMYASTPEMIKLLAHHGANINYLSDHGMTPLKAVIKDYDLPYDLREKNVITLLALGARPDFTDGHFRSTALMEATKRGYWSICMILLETGADKNRVNHERLNAIAIAQKNGDGFLAMILEEHSSLHPRNQYATNFSVLSGLDVRTHSFADDGLALAL